MLPEISYRVHDGTAAKICAFLLGLRSEQLPDGMDWAFEEARTSTQNGTHVDVHCTICHQEKGLSELRLS